MSSFFRAVSTTADILERGGVFSNQVINVIEKDGPICNDSKFQFFQKCIQEFDVYLTDSCQDLRYWK